MILANDPHSLFHAAARLHSVTGMSHWSNHRYHLIHHVMWQVAVQHPIAGIDRIKLDVPSLRYTDEYCVTRKPSRLWNTTALSSCDIKLVPMNVHRMVVHTEIDHPYADSFPLLNNHRSRVRTSFPIYC